jgi:teichuronic acid biosynthesis glycosyltransferase TuaC
MLKIAVITDYFPISTHPWNGHSAYQTLRMLARKCDVHVFFPQAVYPLNLKPSHGKVGDIDRSWNPPDVKATYIPYSAIPVLSRPFNGYASARRLLPYVRAFDPDIVLNYSVYPHGLAAVRIARKLGIPAVLTAIGSDLNRMSDPICARLTQMTLRRADFVTTVSHHLSTTARRLGAPSGSTRAKLNGCDTGIFYPQDRSHARAELRLGQNDEIVVYVGRLDVRKGLQELVEAAAMLHATRPKLKCYMVGDGPDKAALQQAIQTNGAGSYILIEPACLTAQVASWMAASNLVTLPSYAEGCPNVVIEALSAGRPVVASRVGGIPELMNETCGRLIPAHDAVALSRGLDEVLSQPWDAEAIAARNSRSWADVAEDLRGIFTELVGPR